MEEQQSSEELSTREDLAKPDAQEVDSDAVAVATTAKPKDTQSQQKTTIRFVPTTVVKYSPLDLLPALESFPDFCTASKPIFPLTHREKEASARIETARTRYYLATLTSFPGFIE